MIHRRSQGVAKAAMAPPNF